MAPIVVLAFESPCDWSLIQIKSKCISQKLEKTTLILAGIISTPRSAPSATGMNDWTMKEAEESNMIVSKVWSAAALPCITVHSDNLGEIVTYLGT
jgi:hypothetical protein